MRYLTITLLLLFSCETSYSQELKTKNIVLVTLDGLRWQELFHGADSSILFNKNFVKKEDVHQMFWNESPVTRRKLLLPFLWSTIESEGQLYGNRDYKNKVDCANPHWFSYPGYSEILVGYADRKINSNDNIENPHSTVLEFIEQQEGFENQIAVFSTWNTMSFIAREKSSGILVNAGKENAQGNISAREQLLNELQEVMPDFYFGRYDAFTYFYALEYMNRVKPRIIFMSFDETDQHAHNGKYDEYLKAAHRTDAMLQKLWLWLQSQKEYQDKTTLIITTDHGRGKGHRKSWKKHGRLAFGSGQTWIAVLGPDTPPTGEQKLEHQLYQNQIASTMAALLGLKYTNDKKVGKLIPLFFTPALSDYLVLQDLTRN